MLVSVIIPCFNVSKYILECLDCVYNQTYKNIEVICIDNNSTDDTWEILNSLKNEYPDLKIVQESLKGAPATENRGLSIAKGEWIQFLDADDLLFLNKIEHQVNLVKGTSNIAFVVGNCFYIKDTYENKTPYYEFSNDLWLNLIKGSIGYTCSNLFNHEVLKKVGGWNIDQQSSQEVELMFRIIQTNNNVLFDSEVLTYNIYRRGSISNSNYTENVKRFIELRKKIYMYLQERKNVTEEIEATYYESIFNSMASLSEFDPPAASVLYKETFSKDKRRALAIFLPPVKTYLYLIFGFRFMQVAIRAIKKLNSK